MENKIKTLAFIIIAILTSHANANSNDELFHNANSAYDSGNYEQAVAGYGKIIDEGYESWELYYNLGNAYYRMGETGLCILNYERALRLAPGKKTIVENLDLARSKTVDNIEVLPRMFLVEWAHAVASITTPKGWRSIIIILTILTCAAATLFFSAKNYRLRKYMFVIGSLLIVFIIFSSVNAAISVRNRTIKNEAIVTDPMVVVKGSPDHKGIDKFILHEGTKVTINDRQDEWWQIEIADGKNGWINSGAEII